MAANLNTGRTRQVEYCGITYHVIPVSRPEGFSGRGKEDWQVVVSAGSSIDPNRVISPCCPSLPKVRFRIHEHAVSVGAYAAEFARIGRGPEQRETMIG